MRVEDKACNNRTRIRARRYQQEPGTKTEAPRDGSDTGSNKIKHEKSQIRSAATKVNWKHTRETRSRCNVSLGWTRMHACSGEKEQRKRRSDGGKEPALAPVHRSLSNGGGGQQTTERWSGREHGRWRLPDTCLCLANHPLLRVRQELGQKREAVEKRKSAGCSS